MQPEGKAKRKREDRMGSLVGQAWKQWAHIPLMRIKSLRGWKMWSLALQPLPSNNDERGRNLWWTTGLFCCSGKQAAMDLVLWGLNNLEAVFKNKFKKATDSKLEKGPYASGSTSETSSASLRRPLLCHLRKSLRRPPLTTLQEHWGQTKTKRMWVLTWLQSSFLEGSKLWD